jgi:Cu/Ag efflux pump CusA
MSDDLMRRATRAILPLLLFQACLPTAGAAESKAAPVIVEVTAACPGYSAEEVERQVAIPLEVGFADMPRIKFRRSTCLFGLAHLRVHFEAGISRDLARQEVIGRLAFVALPPAITPQLSTETLSDQVLRYTLRSPRDAKGKDIYTLGDLSTLQAWALDRHFRQQGFSYVLATGGTTKRYEVRPDPDRLVRYGITLGQIEKALATTNAQVGGDYIAQGANALRVRSVGLIGGGKDPVESVLGLKDPREAAAKLRTEEKRRLREIRRLVIASVNGVPVLLEDLVEGGRQAPGEEDGSRGVIVGHEPRTGKVGLRLPGGLDEDDVVEGVVLHKPSDDPMQGLRNARRCIEELNDRPGVLLPGVRIEPYYERPAAAPEGAAQGGLAVAWVQGTFPLNISLDAASERARQMRALLVRFPEVRQVVSQVGMRYEDTGEFNHVGAAVVLAPPKDWPTPPGRERPRTAKQLREEMWVELAWALPGNVWDVTPEFRDSFQMPFTADAGKGLLKIFGRDVEGLEQLAGRVRAELEKCKEVSDAEIIHVWGRESLEFRVDSDKCRRFAVALADVHAIIQAAVGGIRASQIVEGQKRFNVTIRLPENHRASEQAMFDIPMDVVPYVPEPDKKDQAGPVARPRLLLRDLVSPVGDDGQPDPKRQFVRPGAVAIYRENGRRMIAVQFRLQDKDTAETLSAVRKKLAHLFEPPYEAEWEVGSSR